MAVSIPLRLRRNIILALTCLGYIFCVGFILSEVMKTGQWFGVYGASIEDFKTNLVVIYVMGALGFLMMILMAGSFINLRRLHRSEKKAYDILSKQMKAVESSIDGIAILDAEGNYTYMNKAHATCYGYDDPWELIGRNWRTLYSHANGARLQKEVFPLLRRDGSWAGQSYGLKHDKTEFPQEITLNMLDDGGLICIVRDLTEKIKNDTLMHMIKLAIEAADDGIAVTDQDNRLLFMNCSFLKIHGYDPHDRENYIGTDWRYLYNAVGQEQINSVVLPTTILKGTWAGAITVMKKDGTLFYGDASLTRLPNGMTLGVMRDISDRKKAELEREELRDQLFQSQKIEAVSRLTGGIVNDFSQILQTISMASDIFISDSASPEIRKEYAAMIHSNAKKANDLVDQLLSFTHKKNVKAGPVNIADCIIKGKRTLEGSIPHNIHYIADIRMDESCTFANPAQIEKIITNLLLNAIDAVGSKQGKVTVALKDTDRSLFGLRRYMIVDEAPDKVKASAVRYKAGPEKHFLMAGFLVKGRDYIQLTVSDSGQGITPDILPNVFDPFFTTKPLEKGVGLGLSTVQSVVTGGSGAIIIETIPGEGTDIHLFFPKLDAVARGAVAQAA